MNTFFLEPYTTGDHSFTGAFGFTVPGNDFCFLLDNNTGNTIIIKKRLAEEIRLKSISKPLLNKLLSHNLVKINSNPKPYFFGTKKNLTTFFIIDISGICNLDCVYCFRDPFKGEIIEESVLLDICSFIDRTTTENGLDNICVQLWGGEPLCAEERIWQVCRYFKDKTYNVNVSIETNGTLITEKNAKLLFENNVSVGISVDGLPEIQALQRPLSNGSDSMAAVIKGVSELKRYYGSNTGGICVITKNNYHRLNEMISYMVNTLGLGSVKFNIFKDNKNEQVHGLGLDDKEISDFTYNLFTLIESYHKLGLKIDESNIRTVFRNLTERELGNICLSAGCRGGRKMVSFDSSGNIYPCDLTDFPDIKMGNIYDGRSLSEIISESENDNTFFKDREADGCKCCPWKYFCKGGCKSRCIYAGKQDSVDTVQCTENKILYPLAIDRILRGKALF